MNFHSYCYTLMHCISGVQRIKQVKPDVFDPHCIVIKCQFSLTKSALVCQK